MNQNDIEKIVYLSTPEDILDSLRNLSKRSSSCLNLNRDSPKNTPSIPDSNPMKDLKKLSRSNFPNDNFGKPMNLIHDNNNDNLSLEDIIHFDFKDSLKISEKRKILLEKLHELDELEKLSSSNYLVNLKPNIVPNNQSNKNPSKNNSLFQWIALLKFLSKWVGNFLTFIIIQIFVLFVANVFFVIFDS